MNIRDGEREPAYEKENTLGIEDIFLTSFLLSPSLLFPPLRLLFNHVIPYLLAGSGPIWAIEIGIGLRVGMCKGKFTGGFWEKFPLKRNIWKISSLPALGAIICSHFLTLWRVMAISEKDRMKLNLKPTLLQDFTSSQLIISPSLL